MGEFITYYPGVYAEKDRAALEKYLAINDGIAHRGAHCVKRNMGNA